MEPNRAVGPTCVSTLYTLQMSKLGGDGSMVGDYLCGNCANFPCVSDHNEWDTTKSFQLFVGVLETCTSNHSHDHVSFANTKYTRPSTQISKSTNKARSVFTT